MSHRHRPSTTARRAGRSLLAAGLAASLIAAVTPAAAAAPTPTPQEDAGVTARAPGPLPTDVTGPLPETRGSYAFGGAAHEEVPEDLAALGYVEEEMIVSGTSNVYSWPADAPAEVRTPDAPYTTRVLVRRPAKAEDFSGTVVVEMLNPSNLFDLNIGWAMTNREMVDSGDAWVGITAKPVAVDALKTFDPQRYADLSFANPLPTGDPGNCSVVDEDADESTPPTPLPDDTTQATENGLVWDAYTQVGNWLRSGEGSNPLTYGGEESEVTKAYGFGYSQTGGYLVNYMKAIHPLVVQAQGAPTYDGYLLGVAGGAFAGAYPMNQCEAAPPVDDPRRDLFGIGVPVIQLMSQSDYLLGIGSRRPDSDTPGDEFRHHEMAGAGHATPFELYFSAAAGDIVKAGRDVPPQRCDQGPRSRFPSQVFFDASLRHLDRWVRDDVSPPRTDPIVVKYGQPVLDEQGNVRGGWRTPILDVPVSTWYGTATGASFCFIAGYEVPLDRSVLEELYDGEADFVDRFARDAQEKVDRGLLTERDAEDLVRKAEEEGVL